MGTIYRLNGLFEYQIAAYPKPFVAKTAQITWQKILEPLFLLLANPGEQVLVSYPLDSFYLDRLKELEIDLGIPVYWPSLLNQHRQTFTQTQTLVEWGKTSHIDAQGKIELDQSQLTESRYLNSRMTQSHWKTKYHLGTLKSEIIKSLQELEPNEMAENIAFPWALKEAFGVSGRNKIIIDNKSQLKMIKASRFPLVLEPWVGATRSFDFSALFNLNKGQSELLCLTEMIISSQGNYIGSCISPFKKYDFENSVSTVLKKIEDETFKNYCGPAAMDCFHYQSETGPKVQIFSEINFRYSMGRVLWEIIKKRKSKNSHTNYYGLFVISNKGLRDGYPTIKSQDEKMFFLSPLNDETGQALPKVLCYLESQNEIKQTKFYEEFLS